MRTERTMPETEVERLEFDAAREVFAHLVPEGRLEVNGVTADEVYVMVDEKEFTLAVYSGWSR